MGSDARGRGPAFQPPADELEALWEAHGVAAIGKLRELDPAAYLKLIARLVGRDD